MCTYSFNLLKKKHQFIYVYPRRTSCGPVRSPGLVPWNSDMRPTTKEMAGRNMFLVNWKNYEWQKSCAQKWDSTDKKLSCFCITKGMVHLRIRIAIQRSAVSVIKNGKSFSNLTTRTDFWTPCNVFLHSIRPLQALLNCRERRKKLSYSSSLKT